ncbi:PAS domain-containing protein [Actinomyces sp. 2119]|uniref:PAS domain-containing protein n=1 Tax=Actinomyces lilanjuaniae TaxID=2321394 RepID=A0ABM6Z6C8_9ACTO|nr:MULTISPECIES: PAS domain-containing protein [Actinomyces]AYD90552.1 PAS domain-containing protein [Actinomyces lilanjuaniae]RJF43996.1 PAS domain-containing protein [Actinomyces sp. 2119]
MESQIGYERLFDPQDIFFSTTDLRGVIQNTNRTFDVLSRYSRERLIGSPHNIVRHLDMPAGLFRLMWDDLQAGRPVCAYVINRAVDGLDYRVFATVVPLRDGFLSVRIKPMDASTRTQVEEAYRRVRAKERELAARAASRRQIGEYGAQELSTELAALGFGSLYEMTEATLPREVAALVAAGVRVPAAAPDVLGPVARILSTVAVIERETNALVYELDEYMRLIVAMEAAHDSISAARGRIMRIGQLVSQDGGGGARTRAQSLAERISELSGTAGSELGGLPRRLRSMHEAVTQLRFAVALMRLLTLMVGRFAQSILDGSEEDAVRSLRDLCEALESGVAGLGPVLRSVSTQVGELDDALRVVTSSLDRAARRLGQWVDARGGNGVSGSPVVDEVASLASQGFPEVRSLAQLAAECRGLGLPYDETATTQRLATIRGALSELS